MGSFLFGADLSIPSRRGCPPLTLRPEIRHLLIPLDGTALGEQAVAPASEIGKLFGSDFTLLLVLDAVPDIHTLTGMTDQGLIPVPGYGEVTAPRLPSISTR